MKNMLSIKVEESFNHFSKTILEQRTLISKKNPSEFVDLLNENSTIKLSEKILYDMEHNPGEVELKYWMIVWCYFQNLEAIKTAYDAKEMIYLSQQEFSIDIEKEIIQQNEQTR